MDRETIAEAAFVMGKSISPHLHDNKACYSLDCDRKFQAIEFWCKANEFWKRRSNKFPARDSQNMKIELI